MQYNQNFQNKIKQVARYHRIGKIKKGLPPAISPQFGGKVEKYPYINLHDQCTS